jgi:hypothetical protein
VGSSSGAFGGVRRRNLNIAVSVADTCEVTSLPKTRIGALLACCFPTSWAKLIGTTRHVLAAGVVAVLIASCSGSAAPVAAPLPITSLSSGVTASDVGDFVLDEQKVLPQQIPQSTVVEAVGFDDVSDGIVVDDELVVTPQPAIPTTVYDPNLWTIPRRTTIPYRGFPPVELNVSENISVGGISIGVPSNWLVLRTKEEVQNTPGLADDVRQRWVNELQSNPTQVFFLRASSVGQLIPTRSGLWVLQASGLSPKEMISRLADSVAAQQFKLGSTGYQKWMGRDGVGAVLSGPDGVRRFITVLLLTDERLLVLQTMGSDEDLGSVQAALLETAKIGAVPPPPTTIKLPPTTPALGMDGKPKVLRN